MTTMTHVKENLSAASEASIGKLTEKDHKLVEEAREVYFSLAPIPCTQCEYCLPCPSDVAIPRIFDLYNDAVTYDAWGRAGSVYADFIKPENRANKCVECGECEEACPQNIKIIE
jgi:uncharacterized protein